VIFLFYLFITLHLLAIAGGMVTRQWPIRPQQLVWRGTSVEVACTQIQALLYDVDDVKFAYPTGQFVPDEAESNHAQGRVVMHEANFKGSKGFGMVKHLFVMAAAVSAGFFEESALVGFLVAFMAFWLASLLAAPFLIAAVLDVIYRRLYRSRISADIRQHPSIADAVTVDLTFRGLSAFGIVGDVVRAAAVPVPPAGSRAAATLPSADASSSSARAANWAGAAERRSTMLYGSGVALSIALAIVLAAADPHPFGGSPTSYASPDAAEASYSSSGGSAEGASGSTGPSDSGSAPSDSGAGATGSSDNTYQSSVGNYSVTPPTDWVRDTEDKNKGSYYETRWHLPGQPEIHGLVDYTPGYQGTPRQGAQGVRKLFQRVGDYQEIDFSPQGDAQRWEFEAQGDHRLDVFWRCGDTGVAILASAPKGEWSTYESDLTGFVDSFECTGPDSASTSGTTSSASGAADGQDYALSTKSGRMERAIRQHWAARLDGNYAKAYGYYTGPLLQRVGLESRWAEGIKADGLNNVTFGRFDNVFVTGDRGRMRVSVTTESDATGCVTWRFTYDMVHGTGRWLIYDSRATKSSC
jgi:hypothetical protein